MKLTPFQLTKLPSGVPVTGPYWSGTYEYHVGVGPSKHHPEQMPSGGYQEVFPSSPGEVGTLLIEGDVPVWDKYTLSKLDGRFVFVGRRTWILRSSYPTSCSICILLERPRHGLAKWIRLARRANTAKKRAKFYRKARQLVKEKMS